MAGRVKRTTSAAEPEAGPSQAVVWAISFAFTKEPPQPRQRARLEALLVNSMIESDLDAISYRADWSEARRLDVSVAIPPQLDIEGRVKSLAYEYAAGSQAAGAEVIRIARLGELPLGPDWRSLQGRVPVVPGSPEDEDLLSLSDVPKAEKQGSRTKVGMDPSSRPWTRRALAFLVGALGGSAGVAYLRNRERRRAADREAH